MKLDRGTSQTPIGTVSAWMLAVFGTLVALMSATARAEIQTPDDRHAISETFARVEVVNHFPCFPRRSLNSFVVEHMRLSTNRVFKAGTIGDVTQIRWIITALPDAAGTVRSIGPSGPTYKASPFWRHPVEIKIQLIVNSVVVKEMSRNVTVLCNVKSSKFGQVINELTSRLCTIPEASGHSNAPCGGA